MQTQPKPCVPGPERGCSPSPLPEPPSPPRCRASCTAAPQPRAGGAGKPAGLCQAPCTAGHPDYGGGVPWRTPLEKAPVPSASLGRGGAAFNNKQAPNTQSRSTCSPPPHSRSSWETSTRWVENTWGRWEGARQTHRVSPGGRGVTCKVMVRSPPSHLCRGFTHKGFGSWTPGHCWCHGEEGMAVDGLEGG